ncbi:aldo/keto reductase [Streptomyces sp. SID12488]|uniref:aldo/keto reductase n=1 Tax=Streptomyces sp. SID12488 TaxID=2706040 RepID=UPI0013DD6FF6|nr:aldo/keto reductase [Streptomyces sp. SID12488]NEA68765.1 aldo/keto reductase [Streptomyces sp. SID12488]
MSVADHDRTETGGDTCQAGYHAQIKAENRARIIRVEAVGKLGGLAATKGITVSQLALAWLLTRGEHVVPIPGTRSVQRIEENTGAVDVPLTGSDLAMIDEILPHGGFGARYSEDHAPVWI